MSGSQLCLNLIWLAGLDMLQLGIHLDINHDVLMVLHATPLYHSGLLDETQNFINCGHKKTGTNPEVQSQGSMYREMAGVPKSIYITCPSDINILKVKIDANCSKIGGSSTTLGTSA